jgi:protein-L-isoaspartate(D-aspartate) O-methyltransferase
VSLEHIESFVKELRLKGGFIARWLEDAVRRVPRHHFIERYYDDKGDFVEFRPADDEQLKLIYSDSCLMIRKPPNHSAASEPCLVMWMLADLDVQPGQKVLEIGTGSGWNAGLLAFRVGDGSLVCSMDAQPDLVEEAAVHLRNAGIEGVNLRAGDGGYGWPEAAPFDRIMATVGCPDIPPAWQEQLAEGGVLLVPLKTAGIGDPVIRLRKQSGRMVGRFSRWSWFNTLQGDYWSDSDDVLQGRLEPSLEALLLEEPQVVVLPEPFTIDFLFFLRLKGLRFQGFQSNHPRALQLHGGFLHRESMSVFSPQRDSPVLRLYGDSDLGKLVSENQQEWRNLGRPMITDYSIELVDTDAVCNDPRSWLDNRQHACLKFTLGRSANQ